MITADLLSSSFLFVSLPVEKVYINEILSVKNEILRQKRWFQFSHSELSIYMYQLSSSICIWSIYLSVDPIFQCLLLLTRNLLNQGFLQLFTVQYHATSTRHVTLYPYWYVMNEERTRFWLRQMEHIRVHLWHIYTVAVKQVMVATVLHMEYISLSWSDIPVFVAANKKPTEPRVSSC
jgi:hypothetical protein